MTMSALRVEMDGQVAVVTFDVPGEPVNTFSRQVREEFAAVFDQLDANHSVAAAIVVSGKPDHFIAGADIEEFLQWNSAAQAEAASREGHVLLDRIERARIPVVAAIHGSCAGGGLEMALACAFRIVTDHPKTLLSLPEVQLGLIPGAGGTQRLPAIVGLETALDIILTGKNVRPRKAAQIGLVHEVVHPSILLRVALERARDLGSGAIKRNPPARQHGARDFFLDENPVGRSVVLKRAREKTLEKTGGHYPAPLAAIDAIAAGYQSRERGFAEEARLFGQMATSDVSRELTFLFFASNALKRDPGVTPVPQLIADVEKLGVLGAGFMGSGIAAIAAQSGVTVRLKDADAGRVGRGLKSAWRILSERYEKKQIGKQQLDDQMLLIGGTSDYTGFADVDCVLEAVFEDLTVKHQVIREVEQVLPYHAIVASNTSTIPIARIAEVSRRPDRVLGMHFFSPVQKMPLLEVIITPQTAPDVIAGAVALGKRMRKTVIVVNDGPGFYVNRILAPYINEAGRLLDVGVGIESIDAAMVQFGFPVGPITLLDEVGLDVAGKSGTIFHEAFGERMAPSKSLRAVVEAGRLGRKGKSGFYTYDATGSRGEVDSSVYGLLPTGEHRFEVAAAEIQRRLVLALVNEAVRCLEDGVIRRPRDGDVGAVFGIGFPAFRGGPFRYVDATGAKEIVEQLEELEFRFTGRFSPVELLVQMARKGERFYPSTGKPV